MNIDRLLENIQKRKKETAKRDVSFPKFSWMPKYKKPVDILILESLTIWTRDADKFGIGAAFDTGKKINEQTIVTATIIPEFNSFFPQSFYILLDEKTFLDVERRHYNIKWVLLK